MAQSCGSFSPVTSLMSSMSMKLKDMTSIEAVQSRMTGRGHVGCGVLVGYVDDGAYSYGEADPAVLSEVLTRKYDKLEQWMHANNLVINPDKTHLMGGGSIPFCRL